MWFGSTERSSGSRDEIDEIAWTGGAGEVWLVRRGHTPRDLGECIAAGGWDEM